MAATKFEFERRFWIICAIYFIAFGLSVFDKTGFVSGLRHLIAPGIARGTDQAVLFSRIVITLGALLVFLAAAMRTWATAYLRTDIVHDSRQHSETLVAEGPFRYVRNPLYLASVLMAAGIGVLASRLGWLFLVAANWLFVYRLIFREEESLKQDQGEWYRGYLAAVPRFWPSFTPRVPAGSQKPLWGQAFVGEMFVWLFGVAELCLAITLNGKLMAVVFGTAFLSYTMAVRLVRKRKA